MSAADDVGQTGEFVSPAEAYNIIGARYERAFSHIPEQHDAVAWMCNQLPVGARVLDVGSGTGVPAARMLANAGMRVTGIDVSSAMVELARRQVPSATFHHVDLRDFTTAPASWDGICAFFALLHMTREEIDGSLCRLAGWLRPGGYLVSATLPWDVENAPENFLGQRFRTSSYTADDFLDRIRRAGLEIVHSELSALFTPNDPDGVQGRYLFAYSRRPEKFGGGDAVGGGRHW